MTIAMQLANAINNDPVSKAALKAVVDSGQKLTARLIRNAVLPARSRLSAGVVSNADFYAAAALVFPNAAISTQEDTTMSNNTIDTNAPVQDITFVYGQDVNLMSKVNLIDAIKRAKADIAKLTDVGVESAYIAGEVTALNAAIAKMVARLDA